MEPDAGAPLPNMQESAEALSPHVGGGGDASSSQRGAPSGGPSDREGKQPSAKRKKGADGQPAPCPSKAALLPFPLAPNSDRRNACHELLERVPDNEVRSPLFYNLVLARFPLKGEHELIKVANQLYIGCMEYHMTMGTQAGMVVSPQVPLEVSETFRRLEEYLPEGIDVRTGNFHEVERARTLRLFCWILRVDTQADKAPEEPFNPLSTKKEDFPLGSVLRLLLAPQATTISYDEVVINVLHENVADLKARAEDLENKLEGLRDEKDANLMKLKKLEEARDAARGSSSLQALATAEDAVITAQANLQCKETAIKRQLKYVKQAWGDYELGCDQLRSGPQKASPEGPPQDRDEPGEPEPMDEDVEAMEEELDVFSQPQASQRAPGNVVTEEDDRMLDGDEEQQASATVSTELSGLNLNSPSGAAAAPQD